MEDQKATQALNDKETKELIVGIYALGVFIATRLKNGYQKEDLEALTQELIVNTEFRTKLVVAIEGVDRVPAEVKAMKFAEVVDLVKTIITMVTIQPTV